MKNLSELNPHDYKGKIFDWDGTLADTLGVWNSVDQKVILDCSGEMIDLDTIYRERTEFLGRTTDKDVYRAWYRFIKDKYGISTKIEDMLESRRNLSRLEFATLDYKPGAADFLQTNKVRNAGKMAIASMTSALHMSVYRTENDVMKKAADIDQIFDYLVLCDDVENVKPHPEIYHKTREKMGLEKHEILVFEDSLHGVRAAKDAGLTVVNVVDKHSSEDQDEINELADYRADNWGELNAIL